MWFEINKYIYMWVETRGPPIIEPPHSHLFAVIIPAVGSLITPTITQR